MIVTRVDARRIIQGAYGQDFKFRVTSKVSVGVRPTYDVRPMLAWVSMDRGRDSAVKLGLIDRTGRIDWSADIPYPQR